MKVTAALILQILFLFSNQIYASEDCQKFSLQVAQNIKKDLNDRLNEEIVNKLVDLHISAGEKLDPKMVDGHADDKYVLGDFDRYVTDYANYRRLIHKLFPSKINEKNEFVFDADKIRYMQSTIPDGDDPGARFGNVLYKTQSDKSKRKFIVAYGTYGFSIDFSLIPIVVVRNNTFNEPIFWEKYCIAAIAPNFGPAWYFSDSIRTPATQPNGFDQVVWKGRYDVADWLFNKYKSNIVTLRSYDAIYLAFVKKIK